MRTYGMCRTGGTIEQSPIPFPTDPTLHHPRPQPQRREPIAPDRPLGQPLTDTENARIAFERRDGQSATVLALRYGVTRQTIYKALRRAKEAS